MSVQDDTKQTNWDSEAPARKPALILWQMSLDEWEAFLDDEITAAELKEKYSYGGDER